MSTSPLRDIEPVAVFKIGDQVPTLPAGNYFILTMSPSGFLGGRAIRSETLPMTAKEARAWLDLVPRVEGPTDKTGFEWHVFKSEAT